MHNLPYPLSTWNPSACWSLTFRPIISFPHLLSPTETTSVAKSFGAERSLGVRVGANKGEKINEEHTLRHSGESVRPQVTQTYCSDVCVFFGCRSVSGTEEFVFIRCAKDIVVMNEWTNLLSPETIFIKVVHYLFSSRIRTRAPTKRLQAPIRHQTHPRS
jgi:hypothetical protein